MWKSSFERGNKETPQTSHSSENGSKEELEAIYDVIHKTSKAGHKPDLTRTVSILSTIHSQYSTSSDGRSTSSLVDHPKSEQNTNGKSRIKKVVKKIVNGAKRVIGRGKEKTPHTSTYQEV